MSSSTRPSILQAIRYRLQWAFEDQISFFSNTLSDFRLQLDENPIDALGNAFKYSIPFLLPLVFFFALYNKSAPIDPSTGQPQTKAQRRLVPRPGTQASVEYTRKLIAEKAEREKKIAGTQQQQQQQPAKKETPSIAETTSMMSAPSTDLSPPLSTPYTPAQLAVFNGVPEGQKIYVAIKGTIFDVSAKPDMYGPGKSYNVFAGRDASKGLGMSSVKIEDATADYSSLNEKELGTLQSWFTFFEKRYNIVGKVVE